MARTVPNPSRDTLVSVLRSHPDWTLAQLIELAGTKSGKLLHRVRIRDLWNAVDPEWLTLAQRLRGPEFDACVLAVIRQARSSVNAGYLRLRVGGPRWKLQSSLVRLAEAGEIERRGVTADTRYRLARHQDN
jgi:hypothetical protein